MSKFSCFGISYGDATHDRGGIAIRVQEAYNKNGRFVAIRSYFPASEVGSMRFISDYPIRPELLPGLIAALQTAQRHSEELKRAELAAFFPAAANDEVGCHG